MISAIQPRARAAVLSVLAGVALFFIQSTQAGTLADVRLVERNSGNVLPIYRHQGEYWVAGRPGANYSIDISNRTGGRIMAVISVDGVNAITGKTASALPEDGYVFDPWQQWGINGWRKSDSEVAAFYFSESSASYAGRTGRPRDVGVIGVALFRERPQEPVRPSPPAVLKRLPSSEDRVQSSSMADESASVAAEASSAAPERAAPAAPAPQPRMSEKSAENTVRRSPSLGTGHGAVETSQIVNVSFEAASRRPEQIVRIRYDSYANLVAKGVIPASRNERVPNPFPGQGRDGYVPDPPRW